MSFYCVNGDPILKGQEYINRGGELVLATKVGDNGCINFQVLSGRREGEVYGWYYPRGLGTEQGKIFTHRESPEDTMALAVPIPPVVKLKDGLKRLKEFENVS